MAAKTQITNKGLELLASSSKATGQHWWIGWYALAFVPDEMQEEDKEKLGPNMTKLTENGDIIYNIFQGDMNGDGYQTTKASSKFKSVNYDSNIKKNYRYVLDDKGRNNLVTWVDGKKGLKGACIYTGVSVSASQDEAEFKTDYSKIPIPAPLLYTGVKAAGEGWSVNGMDIFLGSGNDDITKFYPVDTVDGMIVPRVSTDFRNYEGYKNGLPKLEDGEQGYDYALNGTLDDVDFDGWFSSVNTYTQNDETDMGEDYNQYCYQYWKILSISNFNKYCAPVNASGLLYDENTGCRNMAKATKYFPISDYSVTSTAKTSDNEYATGIKLRVQLKLNGNAEDGAYFKDVEMGDAENVATLAPNPEEWEHNLYNSQNVSFKFNRIGIYAVPMRQYGCSDDSGEMKAQYQIDTEAEPVLFAVCEWDSPVTLSDSGEGLSEFQSDIFVDLSAAVDDSSVIRESAVFYNLYEDDAIDWYKNQLVANAAMGEALINMQIEMGYLRDQKNAKGCCPKSEEIKQNNKVSTGLRNLVDAKDYNSNSVRNRLAQEEGKAIPALYSDSLPHFGGIGYPQNSSYHDFLARFTEGARSAQDFYSAFYGWHPDSSLTPTYANALFDEHEYLNMVPSINTEGETYTTRIGKLWVRTQLYYEMYTFIKPNSQGSGMTYDYPDDADTNTFANAIGDITDWVGEGNEDDSLKYITVTKTASGITTTDGTTTTANYPTELASRSDFVTEITRSFTGYENFPEARREYTVYYTESSNTRDYTGYKFKRKTKLKMPKIQLYKIDKLNTYDNINQRLASTGWRIPTTADWNEIIANSTGEKINKIRSSAKWAGIIGGTGGVFPLGGAMTGRAGTTLQTTAPDSNAQAIYLAIGDDDTHVVVFDGFTFKIIEKPTFADSESGLSYVAVLCVGDAVKIYDGKAKSKLGNDSYALMEGSASEGEHDFNAGKNSIISETANYNSILSGMNNVITDSDHNTVLNGFSNELIGAVHSLVFGDTNTLKKTTSGTPACRMLVAAMNTIVAGGATSEIVTEKSKVEGAYHASIFGANLDINGICCSRFVGENTESSREIYYSDIIAHAVHHMPAVWMSRVTLTNDGVSELPSLFQYDTGTKVFYSDITGNNAYFWSKKNAPDEYSDIYHSRVALTAAGISDTSIIYSDVSADGNAYNNSAPYKNSWFDNNTIEAVNICHSRLKLYGSSIASNYINGAATKSDIRFSDISIGYSIIQLTESSKQHHIDYGVMKVSESSIALCDCSYVYESGTKHYLSSSTIKFATLVGQMISLSGSTFNNLHIYGSLTLASSINNQLILGGLDGTTIGPHNSSASNYISEFGSFITSNSKNYPMIWSLGGIGMYMNKIVLGDNGVASADKKAPSIGDVLSVVGTEDNVATVAWKPGGSGVGGDSHLVVVDTYYTGHYYKDGSEDGYHKTYNMSGGAGTVPFKGVGILRGNGLEAIDSLFTYGSNEEKWFDGNNANNQFRALSVDSASTIDIYTWDVIDSYTTLADALHERYKNLHGHTVKWKSVAGGNGDPDQSAGCPLTIDADSLVEDKVYEIRVHYMFAGTSGTYTPLPRIQQTITSIPSTVSSENPIKIDVTKYTFTSDKFDSTNCTRCAPSDFEVQFKNAQGTSYGIAKWSIQSDNPSTIGTTFKVVMKYMLETDGTTPWNGIILPDIALGSTIFFKHGMNIYVMTY